MPRHMPSRNRKRTNILTILGVTVLLLLIVALINSYLVHQRIKERRIKATADAAASAAALQQNESAAKQRADLAAKQAAAALKAAQVATAANAQTQSFQAAVEETQNYTARLTDIMKRWFAEYSDAKNDANEYRGAHVANLLAIYNELVNYKVPEGLKATKTQLLGEMATALDRVNVDPTSHKPYMNFVHDDAESQSAAPVATVIGGAEQSGEDSAAPKRKVTTPIAKSGATPDAPSWFNAAGDIGAGLF